jgi:hypothetical protein
VKTLREAGVITGVLCSPLLPGINDSLRSLEQVASAAAAAGASFLGAHPLFLKSCSRPTYLSFVREHFPALLPDYERRYARRDFVDSDYRQRMSLLVRRLCATHGLAERATDAILTRDPGVATEKRYFTPRLPVDDPSVLAPAAKAGPAFAIGRAEARLAGRKEPQKASLSYPEPAQAVLFG